MDPVHQGAAVDLAAGNGDPIRVQEPVILGTDPTCEFCSARDRFPGDSIYPVLLFHKQEWVHAHLTCWRDWTRPFIESGAYRVTGVMQEWTQRIPLRAQGTLLTGIRGCDLAPKDSDHLNSLERHLSAYLRHTFLNPADPREVESQSGCWFRAIPPLPEYGFEFRVSSLMHYPMHWISHLMHCFEVVAYYHPFSPVRRDCFQIYQTFCEALHCYPESPNQAFVRFTEDRIKRGNIVS
jgi:hypothetical protein